MAGANHVRMNPVARHTNDRDIAVLTDRLAPELMARAWSEGRAMKLRQVISYALGPATD